MPAVELEHLARRVGEQPPHRAELARRRRRPRSRRGPRPSTRPRPASARPRAARAAARRAAPRPRVRSDGAGRRAGSGGRRCPRGAATSVARPHETLGAADAQQLRRRRRSTWKRAVEPVRAADPAGVQELSGQSTMSTSTRRPSRTAAAFTTVRSAFAVRPPRPMTGRSRPRRPTARGRRCRRPPRTARPSPPRARRRAPDERPAAPAAELAAIAARSRCGRGSVRRRLGRCPA